MNAHMPALLSFGRRAWLVLALLAMAVGAGGCEVAGYVAYNLMADRTVSVKAQYTGLAGQRVAVVVAADEHTLYTYPNAPLSISQAISAEVAANVPGVTLSDPKQIVDFQYKNPHWTTLTYGDLLKRLNVDRLIFVDVSQFSTHEPGNAHIWQGQVVANVGVADAKSPSPNDLVFSQAIQAEYPEDAKIGMVNSDDATIQLGLLQTFARKVGWQFYDHQEAAYK